MSLQLQILMSSSDVYIVYEVRLKGRAVYIGSGLPGREKHTLGASSNAKLNELYVLNKEDMETVVLRTGLTKQESLDLEKEYIIASDPLCNTQHVFKRVRDKRKRDGKL